jgi:hypothetical protein
MLLLFALLALAPNPTAESQPSVDLVLAPPPLAASSDERAEHFVPAERERSKKERWLLEKRYRPDVKATDSAPPANGGRREKEVAKRTASTEREAEARLADPLPPVGTRILPIATLYNLWNREAMPLFGGRPYKRPFQLFLRDHYTKQTTQADTRLALVLVAAAIHFHSSRVEVVSGYRSPKYNLMLRKKGHQVARESQHMQGTAVDFRVRGVTTEALREFVRSLRMGGVGYYPHTHFVHADTGKLRYWSGS